jgi:hypothetical protein
LVINYSVEGIDISLYKSKSEISSTTENRYIFNGLSAGYVDVTTYRCNQTTAESRNTKLSLNPVGSRGIGAVII